MHTYFFRSKTLLSLFFLAIIGFSCFNCREQKKMESENIPSPKADTAITVVSEAMDFQLTDTIKSGWQTFRYSNKSKDPHFMLLEKYPEGKTIDDAKRDLVPVFQKAMDQINQGNMDSAMAIFGNLPEWFPKVVFQGGTGLISPGETAITTLDMTPGYYLIECYVKSPEGIFHSAMGMLEDLVVLQDSADYSPPAPTVSIYISKDEGLVIPDSIGPGIQVFAVNFVDQSTYANFAGHDIHLVRLDEGADIDALAAWMDWTDPKGLITPPPAGVTFLGGVNDMPEGHVGFFTADLTPGTYVLISEVPSPAEKNLLKTFTIPDEASPQ